jgi:hypothetical protein
VCSGGAFGACVLPTETCNAADDDCDGLCDEEADCRDGVHRAFNESEGQHFYTRDLAEATSAPGYRLEAANYFYLSTTQMDGYSPIYRCLLFNATHLYTTSSTCEGAGFVEELMGYIANDDDCGAVPLTRMYHPTGDHLYTTANEEIARAAALGYRVEGIVGYVFPTP